MPVCRVYILLEFGQASGIGKIPCLLQLLEEAFTDYFFFPTQNIFDQVWALTPVGEMLNQHVTLW